MQQTFSNSPAPFPSSRASNSPPKSNNQLQKYQIVKLMGSGDYVCNDQFGNNYLLVCQHLRGGLNQFRIAVQKGWKRNGGNRALLTPFQDIEHGGLRFTAYMLPERSVWLGEAISTKNRSQIYCLSLLYTLINKVLRPLLQLFRTNADKWLHIENIWLKQSTIFYILNQRRQQPSSSQPRTQPNPNLQPLEHTSYQKSLLRKLCSLLAPYFKIDSQLRSFLSIIMDALLNQEFTIDEVCLLLNDKKRRRAFLEDKREKEREGELIGDQNCGMEFGVGRRGEIWNKRKLFVPDSSRRRELVSQTLNIQKSQWQQNTQLYKNQLKNIGQTIAIPPSFGKKKNSFSHSRMFDFRDRSKKRNSLSTERTNRFTNKDEKKTIQVSEEVQDRFKTFVKKYQMNSKYYSLGLSIQEKAYRKFNQKIGQQKKDSARYQSFNIEEQDKKLRTYLETHQSLQKKRSSTIDIGGLRNYRPKAQEKPYETISHQEHMELNNQRQRERERQKQREVAEQRELDRLRQREKQRERQRQRQREAQQRERQQREKQKERQKQKERLKQKAQKQKQLERQRERQRSLERQKQKEREKERQRQRQKQRQEQAERQRRKAEQEKQKQRLAQEAKNKMAKNQSAKALPTGSFAQQAQKINLDEIEIVKPEMKSKLDAKKKEAEQKEKERLEKQRLERERLEKMNKPPLPSGKPELKKSPSIESQLEQIVLDTNKPVKKPERKRSTDSPKPQPQPKPEDSESQARTKTLNSQIASSCGPKKPVSKQVAEYMHMINKMGEGVAKSSRIAAKLEEVQWFTGIYFIYKRFLFERKKIEDWLEKKLPNLTRYKERNQGEWDEWFNSEEKKTLQEKVRLQNENILSSIIKMNKKIMKKPLPPNFLSHASLSRHSQEQSKIAVSEVVKQYDLLDQKDKLNDQQILTHINELLNALYIIAELDGKILEKKPLIQVLKRKNQEELGEFSDFVYDLYIKE